MELVGNRYALVQRQRQAVIRSGVADAAIVQRQNKAVALEALGGKHLAIDGFNLLITLESALSGGFVLEARDGAFRDIASISGSYKRVSATSEAIAQVIYLLKKCPLATVHWFLDAPVSNSGKLKQLLLQEAARHAYEWEVTLVADPDQTIINLPSSVAVSSDSLVIDGASSWFNLSSAIFAEQAPVNVLQL